jgi:hypothetical protein
MRELAKETREFPLARAPVTLPIRCTPCALGEGWIGFSGKCQSGSDRWQRNAEGANSRRQRRDCFGNPVKKLPRRPSTLVRLTRKFFVALILDKRLAFRGKRGAIQTLAT